MAIVKKIFGIVSLSAQAFLALGCTLPHVSADEEWYIMRDDGKWWAYSPRHTPREPFEAFAVAIGFSNDIPRAGVGFSCAIGEEHEEDVFVYFNADMANVSAHWGNDTAHSEHLGSFSATRSLRAATRWPDTKSALENLLANDKVTVKALYQRRRHSLYHDGRELTYQLDIAGASAAIEEARAKCRG